MQSKRYDRQIRLAGIGVSGQAKLSEAKVLIVGAGGLGCPVLQCLAAAGVGHIGIVDGDFVEETNLHRQLLYTPLDLGRNKATAAKEAVCRQNPEVIVTAYPNHFVRQNAIEILSTYTIIVDCTDDNAARYLINDIAVYRGIPMVHASIHKFDGQLSVFNYKDGPTYRCLFPEQEQPKAAANCNESGVLGVLPNLMGTMQANEVLKIILGVGEVCSGRLLLYHSLQNSIRTLTFEVDATQKEIGLQHALALTTISFAVDVVSPAQFFSMAATPNTMVVDIRESYEEPKLDRAVQVSLADLDNFLKQSAKNSRIILICQHGSRSKQAADYMAKNGFNNLYHLMGGIEALLKYI